LVDAILSKPITASNLYNAVTEAKRRRARVFGSPHALRHSSSSSNSGGLDGVRLLVVDDSEINREVAQRILHAEGATVVLAVDGKDALEQMLAAPDAIDLILMDVQMPVMDGIEATRQLRRLPQFNHVPIVALTAGAFKSQQDAAHAAGMTHFISKPFDVPSTIALIQRLTRGPAHAGGDLPRLSQADFSESSDKVVLDVARGLRLWSDLPAYRTYLRRFVDSYADAVDVMNASLADGNGAAAAVLAHKLAGVAANLALPDTHKLANEAAAVLTAGADPTLVLAHLRDALVQAVTEIEQLAPHPTHAAVGALSLLVAVDLTPDGQAALSTLLHDLAAALDGDDPRPVEPILAALGQQLPRNQLEGLLACVRGFDFRGAEACVLALGKKYGIH
jgi:CheY-like chemotaxis protein